MKSFKYFFIFFFLASFFAANFASAWVIGEPLVPCGGPSQPACSQCELLHLVDNLMDFILIAAAPILATFFFILAGLYIMLGGAKPDMLATGKRMFTSALVGIIIVMLAWLITNTLITTLIAPTPFGGNISFNSSEWWSLACDTIHLDTNPPSTGGGGGGATVIISGESATQSSNTAEIIIWTTNVPATSQVSYGTTSALNTNSSLDPNLVTSHRVVLQGLTLGTTYFYRVTSAYNFYVANSSTRQFTAGSATSCSPACTNGQVCIVNSQGQNVCTTPPSSSCGPCDPVTNNGCFSGQRCVLNISTNICSCR